MGSLRRLVGLSGALGALAIGLAATPIGLFGTAAAAGGGCSGGGGPTPGSTQVFATHLSGLSAIATFESVSGTTQTDWFISALQSNSAQAGSGTISESCAFVGVTVLDTVTLDYSVQAFGFTSTPNFQIDKMLTSATLSPTSIEVFDYVSNTSSTATISAAWIGTGSLSRSIGTSTFHSGDFTAAFSSVDTSRDAAASGSVSDEALNVSLNQTASSAQLESIKFSNLVVCVGGNCEP